MLLREIIAARYRHSVKPLNVPWKNIALWNVNTGGHTYRDHFALEGLTIKFKVLYKQVTLVQIFHLIRDNEISDSMRYNKHLTMRRPSNEQCGFLSLQKVARCRLPAGRNPHVSSVLISSQFAVCWKRSRG